MDANMRQVLLHTVWMSEAKDASVMKHLERIKAADTTGSTTVVMLVTYLIAAQLAGE